MLDWLYARLDFWLSLLFLWSVLVMIIFWFAGIAGIMLLPAKPSKALKLFFGLLFPPFTVGWMIFDMFQQRRMLKEGQQINKS